MGDRVKHYLPAANEIPPLLLLPYLHGQVEQVRVALRVRKARTSAPAGGFAVPTGRADPMHRVSCSAFSHAVA